jgi:hypothetical protein
MEVYYLNTLSDYDVENETEVYYQTVRQVKDFILNHKEETRIMIKDNAWKDVTLLLLNNPITDDEDWEGKFALTTKEDYETDGFIGAVGDEEGMYRWICSWLNGDYDYDDYEMI